MKFDPDLCEACFRLLPKTTLGAAGLALSRDGRLDGNESLVAAAAACGTPWKRRCNLRDGLARRRPGAGAAPARGWKRRFR